MEKKNDLAWISESMKVKEFREWCRLHAGVTPPSYRTVLILTSENNPKKLRHKRILELAAQYRNTRDEQMPAANERRATQPV